MCGASVCGGSVLLEMFQGSSSHPELCYWLGCTRCVMSALRSSYIQHYVKKQQFSSSGSQHLIVLNLSRNVGGTGATGSPPPPVTVTVEVNSVQ